jgi:hypothetical protein
VTTQSSTFASIQVNCTPGTPPVNQTVFVHPDPKPGTSAVTIEDLFYRRPSNLSHPDLISRRHEIAIDRMDKPERGVDRVVFRLLAYIGETIRHHAFGHMLGERSDNLPRHIQSTGY